MFGIFSITLRSREPSQVATQRLKSQDPHHAGKQLPVPTGEVRYETD